MLYIILFFLCSSLFSLLFALARSLSNANVLFCTPFVFLSFIFAFPAFVLLDCLFTLSPSVCVSYYPSFYFTIFISSFFHSCAYSLFYSYYDVFPSFIIIFTLLPFFLCRRISSRERYLCTHYCASSSPSLFIYSLTRKCI